MIISFIYRGLGKSACQNSYRYSYSRRPFSRSARWRSVQASNSTAISRTRNVGIIAHIDAGKTTTTERMLYYSGYTKRIGNVDEGSTVTDFLPAERARGITIQSAAITFQWTAGAWISGSEAEEPHVVNLIDTPGHADFTFEVLRSLRVLDGAVCILDGVAGVEAQTEKVWHQARTYGIPAIFYINKMDREGARFGASVRQIASKLRIAPAVCHIPWHKDGKEGFQGVIDVVRLRGIKWTPDSDGKDFRIVPLTEIESEDPKTFQEARKARTNLIELLSEEDEVMVEKFLEYEEDHLAVPADEIWASLRRCLLASVPRISPVFAGSSFKNTGVQPLLDAITTLLPSPEESGDPTFAAGSMSGSLRDLVSGKLSLTNKQTHTESKALSRSRPMNVATLEKLEACALAFKVVNDLKRGILVYVRVYHGCLNRNTLLYNTNLQTSERIPRLLRMYASDAIDETSIKAGDIGVIPGLKNARTGDTLITYAGAGPKTPPPAPFSSLQLKPIPIPPPVFFTAVEPFSTGDQAGVNASLALLLREDPSLQISESEETGQQLLNGMGELHLEIASSRLIQDFKAKASIGKIEIAYRESPSGAGPTEDVVYERAIAGTQARAGCMASVSALTDEEMRGLHPGEGNMIIANGKRKGDGEADNVEVIRSLQNGALSALARGPNFGYPVHGAKVDLTYLPTTHSFGSLTTTSAISGAARKATQAALEASAKLNPAVLLEPVMRVIVSMDENTLGAVKRDIETSRNGIIESLGDIDTITGYDDGDDDGSNPGSRENVVQIDLHKIYAPPDPFEGLPSEESGNVSELEQQASYRGRSIVAKVPLKEMIGYLKHLRSITAGKGSFVMEVDGFKRMTKQRENVVLKELRGELY